MHYLDHVVVGTTDDQPAVILNTPHRRHVANQHMQTFSSLGKGQLLKGSSIAEC